MRVVEEEVVELEVTDTEAAHHAIHALAGLLLGNAGKDRQEAALAQLA